MKKITRISVPRRVVLPLAAAAFLAACDDQTPSTYKTTNVAPSKSREDAPERVRATTARTVEQRGASKLKTSTQRGSVKVHHVI